jgi:hypothetical protein
VSLVTRARMHAFIHVGYFGNCNIIYAFLTWPDFGVSTWFVFKNFLRLLYNYFDMLRLYMWICEGNFYNLCRVKCMVEACFCFNWTAVKGKKYGSHNSHNQSLSCQSFCMYFQTSSYSLHLMFLFLYITVLYCVWHTEYRRWSTLNTVLQYIISSVIILKPFWPLLLDFCPFIW